MAFTGLLPSHYQCVCGWVGDLRGHGRSGGSRRSCGRALLLRTPGVLRSRADVLWLGRDLSRMPCRRVLLRFRRQRHGMLRPWLLRSALLFWRGTLLRDARWRRHVLRARTDLLGTGEKSVLLPPGPRLCRGCLLLRRQGLRQGRVPARRL